MRFFFLFLIFFSTLYAKEIFTQEMIRPYLTRENPFVYETLAKESIYKKKKRYYLGAFDTKITAKYDKKEYPTTKGTFFDVAVEKPTENGIEFIAGYREAEGIQEYNNIKTGQKGEVRAGIKIPLLSLITHANERKTNLKAASLKAKKMHFYSQENMRHLSFEILKNYFQILYSQNIVKLEEELLFVARKRKEFIKKRVASGALPEISLLEATQLIISAKQRCIIAKNDFSNTLEMFVQYLNISKEDFQNRYTFPEMPKVDMKRVTLEDTLTFAMEHRPDLKMYDYEIKKISQYEQLSTLLKYPNINVGLYGVHDFMYESGFKLSLSLDFPIERRKYEGKSGEIQMSLLEMKNKKNKTILTIKTKLLQQINTLKTIQENIQNANQEVLMVEKLQEAENKKYILGQSNLFMLNQREMLTLQTKKKLLQYKLQYLLVAQEINKEIGITLF